MDISSWWSEWGILGIAAGILALLLFIAHLAQRVGSRDDRDGYTFLDNKDIPSWVKHKADGIHHRYGGTSSSFLDKYWTLTGSYFRYRVYWLGQGGSTLAVSRKKK